MRILYLLIITQAFFYKYQSISGKVQRLGVHNVVETSTLKYTFIDDNGDQVNLLINDNIHVPTTDAILIALQQIAQQSLEKAA